MSLAQMFQIGQATEDKEVLEEHLGSFILFNDSQVSLDHL